MMLEIGKFKKVNLTTGLPYMSVTDNGMTFSKSAVIKMNKPSYVELLLNEDDKQLAIRACDKSEEGSIAFAKSAKSTNVRMNNKDFLNTLSRMMGWDLKESGYRVSGEWFEQEQIMLFDMKQANMIGEKENESDD